MKTGNDYRKELDDLWELLAQDIHANGDSVRDAIEFHRDKIEDTSWDWGMEAGAMAAWSDIADLAARRLKRD